MKIAIHQPQYLPWPGYFNKIMQCDLFIFLDDVQYKKNEWQNRNRIKSAAGIQWLTVPVHYKFGQKINEIKIDNHILWRKDHLKSIKVNYNKAKYFYEFFVYIEELLNKEYKMLVDINVSSIIKILSYLGIDKPFKFSSELKVEGEKTDRLVNICKKLSADIYISGSGAKEYLEVEKFIDNGINVIFQEYKTPDYPQLFDEFIPNISIIDMIFNVGKEETLKLVI